MQYIISILYILVVALIIVGVPFALLVSLNTLFPVLAIKYGFMEWLSAVCVLVFFGKQSTKKD